LSGVAIRVLGAGLLLLGTSGDARPSEATARQEKTPAAAVQTSTAAMTIGNAANKIWRNEDLVALRKPWDIYLDQEIDAWQKAQEEAEKEAKAAQARASRRTPAQANTLTDNTPIPTTIDELQVKIKATEQEVRQLSTDLDVLKRNYALATSDDLQAKLKYDVDLVQNDLKDRQDDLALLQARLNELNGAPAATGSGPAAPPSPDGPQTSAGPGGSSSAAPSSAATGNPQQ
jgi:predicted RNase H-like nuclease (RuvC/YqgF family)